MICHFFKEVFSFLSRFNASTVLLLIEKKTSKKPFSYFTVKKNLICLWQRIRYLQAWNIYFAFDVECKYNVGMYVNWPHKLVRLFVIEFTFNTTRGVWTSINLHLLHIIVRYVWICNMPLVCLCHILLGLTKQSVLVLDATISK